MFAPVVVMVAGTEAHAEGLRDEVAAVLDPMGLRLSEQAMGLQPMARHFPNRNRIISGLCRATIVVEAPEKSGALITARLALEDEGTYFKHLVALCETHNTFHATLAENLLRWEAPAQFVQTSRSSRV